MSFRTKFAKSTLAGVAGVMALSAAVTVPTFAAAQSAGYYDQREGGYYDPCRRSSTNRGTTGALIGGALGAVIGSNAAARNARTEGALLGGALGAMGGAAVGKNSAACNSYRDPRSTYYDNGSRYGETRRDNGYYAGAYDRDRGYDDDRYAYDSRGTAYGVADREGADGCSLAESPIYLPDGRVQKRFVRVCQDASGNYQVVD
ncbi:glycine zipper 2TM domain-containing protein [Phenylobacterium sp.]|uniref:glycine zipper 2TM domain-containing protein n=1 Tax=Phenylobacterium sp. TaxID=1871053 RepID=UPI002737280C|nr:glycine zipper 2TM domain-containing protein [Phenylobacterium sp.]MDP3855249.1 glycine zipper 2TM domain-containing protein [Phenylobacterium sp.]